MLTVFEFGVLLFDFFVYRENVACNLKSYTRFGQNWALCRWGGRHNHRHQTRSCIWNCRAKNWSV